jgi:polysaccharide transporter, PST family
MKAIAIRSYAGGEPGTLDGGLAATQLAAQARKGTHAALATRLLAIVTTAASITIFARLISPAQFGVWAIAGLPLGLMTIVRELGLVPSIVQAPSLTREQQDAYFWTSVAISLACAGLLAAAAPLLAHFYQAPLLQPVLWACSIALAISGLGLVHAALLRRRLQYGKLVVLEGGGMLCGLVAGLAVGFLRRDVWAFVAGYVASAAWMSASAWVLCRWLPGARPGRFNLAFSLQIAFSNLLTFTGNNVGLLVGYRFGAADLGYFNRGQQLFNLVHLAVLTPLTEVGFALLCRLRSDAVAYRHAYVALARRVALLFMPYAAVLPLVSGDLIRVLLGPEWAPAAPVLAWFAPAVAGQAFAALFAQLMMSQGRGGELRNWAVVDLLLRAGGALLGSAYGIAGMAAGFSLATLLFTVPMMVSIAGRSGPVGLRDQAAAWWPGLATAAGAALAGGAAAIAAERYGLEPGLARLLLVGGSAALAWGALCAVVRPARDALLGRVYGDANGKSSAAA